LDIGEHALPNTAPKERHTMSTQTRRSDERRADLERSISADMRALSAESDHVGRHFASVHDLGANDFRALLHIMVAENGGTPMTAGELSRRMQLSGSAITYLVERMIESGHIWRKSDPTDRRKVILCYSEHGFEVARAFFSPLGAHTHHAMADLSDRDLAAGHRVFSALIGAMRTFRADLSVPKMPGRHA
jgi:DNA-binding MarR family transcriptional regulator